MKCFSAESADLDSAHVSKGTCVIRPCFTNLWLKLKSSDGEKERGGCIVFFVLLFRTYTHRHKS